MCTFEELLKETQKLSMSEDIESYVEKAIELYERNRLNLWANYLYADAMFKCGEWLESYRKYSSLYKIQEIYKEYLFPSEELEKMMNVVLDYACDYMSRLPKEEMNQYKEALLAVNAPTAVLNTNEFYSAEQFEDFYGEHNYFGYKQYIAKYDDWYGCYFNFNKCANGIERKCEIYNIAKKGNEFTVMKDWPCVVPVVSNIDEGSKRDEEILVYNLLDRSVVRFKDTADRKYSYYRIDAPSVIKSEKEMIFGNPIPLKENKGLKKLVLSIFVDSFNWKVIKENGLKELMPYTYEFFKDGMICNEFYTGSEFTYPSIATYWTGLRSTHHQVLNGNVHLHIPEKYPLLSEIFKDQGYFTAKIGGNGSVSPKYGYSKGIDRFVYQETEQNFHVSETVSEVLEHMKAFEETNMFIWMDLMDLHEVAGYWPMPLSVQTLLPVEVNEVDNIGGSSLYQTPSVNRRKVYNMQLKHMDWKMKELYEYIKEKFSKEEVVVALFADHGNAFNIDAGESFMSVQRTNVPLMLYGSGVEPMENNDLMENVDYMHILSKLAGFEDERLAYNDGQMPLFLGGKEKEYVFSQSLFPDRYYEAAIVTKEYEFYFKSKKLVLNDCRIDIEEGTARLLNKDRVEYEDAEIVGKCMDIIKENLGDYLIG